MNKLILCEGKTDALLLGYYLGKVANWKKCQNAPGGLEIKPEACNQSAYWYQKDGDNLLICAVGGKANFQNFFKKKILPPLLLQDAFGKVSVVTDRDDHTIQEIEAEISSLMKNVSVKDKVQNGSWIACPYTNFFKEEKSLEFLLLVVPKKSQGALEKVMLKAVGEKSKDDEKIVEETKKFAKDMRKGKASKYIHNDSLELKAHLRLTWAVLNPENFATTFDEEIGNFPWEKSDTLRNCFSKLIEI